MRRPSIVVDSRFVHHTSKPAPSAVVFRSRTKAQVHAHASRMRAVRRLQRSRNAVRSDLRAQRRSDVREKRNFAAIPETVRFDAPDGLFVEIWRQSDFA